MIIVVNKKIFSPFSFSRFLLPYFKGHFAFLPLGFWSFPTSSLSEPIELKKPGDGVGVPKVNEVEQLSVEVTELNKAGEMVAEVTATIEGGERVVEVLKVNSRNRVGS